MRFSLALKLGPILAVVAALVLTVGTAVAHEGRDLGEFRTAVGFIVEPPLEGQKNGVDLRVMHVHKEGDKEELEPVEGLEKTLQVEITHVPSGASRVFNLRTIFRDPGHYTADLLLTAPGHYRFRFFGTIEGLEVNETFNSRSGGGGFNDVESSADIQFPERLPEVREVFAAVKGAQNAAEQAQDAALTSGDTASLARTLAVVGIVLGALGIASGVGSAIVASRRGRRP